MPIGGALAGAERFAGLSRREEDEDDEDDVVDDEDDDDDDDDDDEGAGGGSDASFLGILDAVLVPVDKANPAM